MHHAPSPPLHMLAPPFLPQGSYRPYDATSSFVHRISLLIFLASRKRHLLSHSLYPASIMMLWIPELSSFPPPVSILVPIPVAAPVWTRVTVSVPALAPFPSLLLPYFRFPLTSSSILLPQPQFLSQPQLPSPFTLCRPLDLVLSSVQCASTGIGRHNQSCWLPASVTPCLQI